MGDLRVQQDGSGSPEKGKGKASEGNKRENPSQHPAFAGIDLIDEKLQSIGLATGCIVAFSDIVRSEQEPKQKRAIAIAAKGDKCVCKINAEGKTLSILVAAIQETFSSNFTVSSGELDNYIELTRRQ